MRYACFSIFLGVPWLANEAEREQHMEHPVRQLPGEILGLQVPMANVVPYVVSEGVDKEHLQVASQVLTEAFLH
jgi:hypothetical protein